MFILTEDFVYQKDLLTQSMTMRSVEKWRIESDYLFPKKYQKVEIFEKSRESLEMMPELIGDSLRWLQSDFKT